MLIVKIDRIYAQTLETGITARADIFGFAIDADDIGRAIAFAIEQPGDVDVNEIILRPTRQELHTNRKTL